MIAAQAEIYPPVIHPTIRAYRMTGTKSLCVNLLHVCSIKGMDRAKVTPLLNRVFAHGLKPQYQYLHDYRVGDLVIWDQRRTCIRSRPPIPFTRAGC
jgi:taurine dioxygenase